jgi:4-amino-4-deoxy-L-arabinose transferase-like glycosyltransferase
MKAPLDSTFTPISDKAEIIVEPGRAAKHLPFAFLSVIALSALIFFFGLGHLALVGPDEPRYAEVAREMLVTGDYISPRLCGCLWFEKPVLLYWMSAVSYHLFGNRDPRLPLSRIAAFRFAWARSGRVACPGD